MSRRAPIPAAPSALTSGATRACWFALVLAALPISANAETKLVLQLHREPQFEFAGYYAALWEGFYQAAGFDVEIKPGTPPGAIAIDPVREITEGRAQFGTGTVQLLVRAAQGQSLLLLAPVFQQSGAAVYYRADRDLSLRGAPHRQSRTIASEQHSRSRVAYCDLRRRHRSAKSEICFDGDPMGVRIATGARTE